MTRTLDTHGEKRSLMTPIGIVEGDVLMYLEQHGRATLRMLNRELAWPSYLVVMGVGALIRSGLVRATQLGLEIILQPRKPLLVQ